MGLATAISALLLALTPTFVIGNASAQYDFRIAMAEGCGDPEAQLGACAGPAQLIISRKSDKAEIQRIAFSSVWVELGPNQQPLVNASPRYDSQGTINVGDFNFDGREDFAVQIDQSGSYGGPTFDVYLALPNGSFVRSEPLSRLTRERLGMFEVDAQKKHLVTFEKSGCCYHVTEELAVVGDAPVPVFRLIEDATGDAVIVTKERWVKGKWHRKVRRVPKAP